MTTRLGLVLILVLCDQSGFAQETGTITGRLLDPQDQQILVGRAAVFICDAATGHPLIQGRYQPLGTKGPTLHGLADLAHAVTDSRGYFEFKDVPAGQYRLVAQSWLGFSGVPMEEEPSEFVHLHGIRNDVEVKPGENVEVFIRPLGAATMTLINDPQEEHALLVLSTAPTRGDPVLGFPFWGNKFAAHAIGITLMETHKVTFHGLPEGEIHAGLFNFDNNPGVGGATFKVTHGGTARIPIYATWSNGKFNPPDRLLPLVEHLEQTNIAWETLLKARFPQEFAESTKDRSPEFAVCHKHGDETLSVEGFGDVRILDLAAADTYRQLRQYHKRRAEAR